MKCQVCGKELQKVVTALPFKLEKKRILIVKVLPTLQCDECGGYLLEDDVMARVEEMIERSDADSGKVRDNSLSVRSKR